MTRLLGLVAGCGVEPMYAAYETALLPKLPAVKLGNERERTVAPKDLLFMRSSRALHHEPAQDTTSYTLVKTCHHGSARPGPSRGNRPRWPWRHGTGGPTRAVDRWVRRWWRGARGHPLP